MLCVSRQVLFAFLAVLAVAFPLLTVQAAAENVVELTTEQQQQQQEKLVQAKLELAASNGNGGDLAGAAAAQSTTTTPPLGTKDEKEKKKEKKKVKKKEKPKKKKSTKDWSKINIDEMSAAWDDGDEEEEKEHEYERDTRIAEKKAEAAQKLLRSGDPKSVKSAIDSGAMDTKASMVFVTLTDTQVDGSPWEMPVQERMIGRWTALLRTASLHANFYNMSPGEVLLQVNKPWMFSEVIKFTMQQPEVVKGYKDGKNYLPSQYVDDDDEL